MDKLKKQVIGYFLIFSFAIAVVESMVDSIFDDYLFKIIADDSIKMKIFLFLYITIAILIFVFFGFVFSKIVCKKIENEAHRQLNDRNMLYTNITHDLKTPITSIMGFAKALQDKKVNENEKDRVIDIIYTKAKRTDELINMLFGYTKLETDGYQMVIKEQEICTVLRNIVALNYESFEEKKINLDIDIPEHKIMINIDEIEISRAINNLIVNAYRHNKQESKVGVILKVIDNKVKIIIADNGINISKDEEESIFKPFNCGDDSRKMSNGSGLGLAISQKIVEKHGGRLCVEHNILGYVKGFVIYLGEIVV